MSIENQASWCAKMRDRKDVGFWIAQGKLRYECVDIGDTGTAGMPKNMSDSARFPEYAQAISRFFDEGLSLDEPSEPGVIDVVLVDGRFRVACAINALWHIDDASVVLIHDYGDRMQEYSAILAYYDIVDQVDTMVVLARRPHIDWERAKVDLHQYTGVPRR